MKGENTEVKEFGGSSSTRSEAVDAHASSALQYAGLISTNNAGGNAGGGSTDISSYVQKLKNDKTLTIENYKIQYGSSMVAGETIHKLTVYKDGTSQKQFTSGSYSTAIPESLCNDAINYVLEEIEKNSAMAANPTETNEYINKLKNGETVVASDGSKVEVFSKVIAGIDGNTTYGIKVTKIIDTQGQRVSTAGQLRSAISTWYKTLRVIALVGLLSVLVYVGIRIILSSTGQEKAKYKNMVTDWLVAICLLFVLHYIMAFTMQITDSILGIFSENTSIVGDSSQDVLMSSVRKDLGEINDNTKFVDLFSKIIIYIVLVIYTVMFVLQYLKRVVWLAFLTMIAPLITLTYPIDKIKDGKAQAFTMWIREYVFNALLPVIHIVLYYMLVGSAMNFIITGGNWLYAIVAVGFLMQAEKFFRKMFGFDQASSAGALGAAAGGALVMNAINKMGQKSGKQAAGASASSGGSSTGKSNAGVRTGDGSALAALNGGVNPGGTNPRGRNPGGTNPGGTNSGFSATLKDKWNNAPRPIKGVANLAKNQLFTRSAAQRNLRAMGKVVGGAAGLTAGLAAGVSTGDFGKALQYGAAGVAGGAAAGGGLANFGFNAYDSTVKGIDNLRYGYDEGAYGEEEAQNRQFDREFKRSEDYKKMLKNHPGSEKDIDSMLKAGITDPTRMNTILKNMQDYRNRGINNINIGHGIAYNQLANDCGDSILYDNNKLRTFLNKRGISASNDADLDRLRQSIIDFK